jgi:CHAD domain-containing protein
VLDREAADRVIKDLKALQRLLGTFQDQEVHAAALAALAAEKMAAKRAPTETVLAIGALVDRLRAAQVETRASFERTFAAFDSPKVAAHVDALLAGPE